MERTYADLYEPTRWRRTRARLKRLGLWLWGAVGLGGVVAAYFGSVATELLPAPHDLVCLAEEQFRKPAPGTQFTILISNLAGDPEGQQTRLVRDVFLNERGLDVRSTCRVVRLNVTGGSLAAAKAAASEEGRALLEARNADLLIWGEVKKADRELNLWFLSSGSSTLGAPSYSLTEKLTLPENFPDLGAQLQGVALAQVAPATEQAGTYLVGVLKPARSKIEQLLANPPPELDEEQKADLRFSLALAAQTIGEQAGENEPLEAAVDEYRAALEVRTRERVPLDWAMTQNNLGTALSTLGAREAGTQRLDEAVAAYRAALEVRTRERVPLDWAMTQNNLGAALRALGAREAGTQRLEQAVDTYRAALEVRTRERVPLDWAMTQDNLGNALETLGEREDGTQRLEQAVDAYRAALGVRTRERVPLDWAMTQNNLGTALSTLSEREDGTQRLRGGRRLSRGDGSVRARRREPLRGNCGGQPGACRGAARRAAGKERGGVSEGAT